MYILNGGGGVAIAWRRRDPPRARQDVRRRCPPRAALAFITAPREDVLAPLRGLSDRQWQADWAVGGRAIQAPSIVHRRVGEAPACCYVFYYGRS